MLRRAITIWNPSVRRSALGAPHRVFNRRRITSSASERESKARVHLDPSDRAMLSLQIKDRPYLFAIDENMSVGQFKDTVRREGASAVEILSAPDSQYGSCLAAESVPVFDMLYGGCTVVVDARRVIVDPLPRRSLSRTLSGGVDSGSSATVSTDSGAGAAGASAAVTHRLATLASPLADSAKILTQKERRRLEVIEAELAPLREQKKVLDLRAEKEATRLMWYGLGALVTQWLVLARLVWWELNWDVMEPVTYFITSLNGIIFYAYYCVTQNEATFESFKRRSKAKRASAMYKRENFDVMRWEELEAERAFLKGEKVSKKEQE